MAGKLFKFLPKAASFSINPSGSNKQSAAGFSGPIAPKEPRRAKKKTAGGAFDDREPTSPKVSCMGQVKNGEKKKKLEPKKYESFNERKAGETKKKVKKHQSFDERKLTEMKKAKAKAPSGIQGLFRRKGKAGLPPAGPGEVAAAPEVGRMRRYASGRASMGDFDWRSVAAAVGGGEEEKVLVSHSGPILMGGGGVVAVEKKKEVNIWKRRTLTAPVALQV